MKRPHGAKKLATLALMVLALALAGCKQTSTDNTPLLAFLGGGGGGGDPYASAVNPGDAVAISAGAADFNMIYAGDSAGITFPTEFDDNGTATLLRNFFLGETEVTNDLVAEVFQWALVHGRLSTASGAHNEVNESTVMYGGRELLDLDHADARVVFDAGAFSLYTPGDWSNYAVMRLTWYGAVMFCNWLTEMTDGNAANLVYTGITETWNHEDTVSDPAKSGYRLPSMTEWTFASRYIGQTAPAAGNLATDCISQGVNGGDPSLTAGYYWNPGQFASGALASISDAAATDAVARSSDNSWGSLYAIAQLLPNQLGIYDMSGSVYEWCFDRNGSVERVQMSSSYLDTRPAMRLSYWNGTTPDNLDSRFGLRLARTRPSAGDVAVTGLSLDNTTANIFVDGTEQLAAIVSPAGASHPGVTWTSSDISTATVSISGLVTGVIPGTVYISAVTEDGGLYAECQVTVADPFPAAANPGDVVAVTAWPTAFNMIYANNTSSITFPYMLDNTTATLTRKFFMGETEVTNRLVVVVYNWALEHGKFSSTVTDPNGMSDTTVKWGGRQLIDLDETTCRINLNPGPDPETMGFSLDAGYADHPAVHISWYGAIMFCNWLTEMKYGNTDNVVYTGIDTDWLDDETIADTSKTGYRLPTLEERQFAAKYIGQTAPTEGDLPTQYVAQSVRGGDASLTAGYYWTPAGYASGAISDTSNADETQAVAWYDVNAAGVPHQVATTASHNQLGIYDMCGNVYEWMFDDLGTGSRVLTGGSYATIDPGQLALYMLSYYGADGDYYDMGFRIAKSQ